MAAGASIVNDVSGLADPELIEVVASSGAGLIVMHTRLAPKTRLAADDAFYDSPGAVVDDVVSFLGRRLELLEARGVTSEHVVLDPGPDFAKTPAQTVAALQGLPALVELGRPILLALSRKDVIGAITGRPPRGARRRDTRRHRVLRRPGAALDPAGPRRRGDPGLPGRAGRPGGGARSGLGRAAGGRAAVRPALIRPVPSGAESGPGVP